MIRVWRMLQRLRSLEFRISDGNCVSDGCDGYGRGQVSVTEANDGLRVRERGEFTPPGGGRGVTYHNVYRWQWQEDCLALSHERFGTAEPVHLVDLVPVDDTTLVAVKPHACGHDGYHARVRVIDAGVNITWCISGPRKNTRIHTVYRTRQFD